MTTSTVIRNLESETILRVSWRLLPFLIAAYLVNYIERWSRFTGQFGGKAKMDSWFNYAASFSSFSCIA